MSGRDLRAVAAELQRAALTAVEPAAAVHRHVRREGDALLVADRRYDLSDYERVLVVGGGKAAAPMAGAIADILDDRLTAGVVVAGYGHDVRARLARAQSPIELIEAGHPIPDENSVRGAQAIADCVARATERDLVLCLISGGGSALLTLPVPGLTLADLQSCTDALLRSGATIHELNTVRKHWSRIKGGNLARLAAPATLVTLVLSDVVGDRLDVIASGPTVPDPTTVADAHAVLARYGIQPFPSCRGGVKEDVFQETPKPGDPAFERVQHVIVGSNRLAARAAVGKARRLGFNALLLSTYVEGEAREVGRVAAALTKGMCAYGDPLPPPACLVWGGETTVTVRGEGKGGRNQELALAAALALDGWSDVLVMALATDGADGPTDGAGAVVTGETMTRARALGLDPRAALENNDSYTFFDALDDLIRTGPTGTNVNDLLFMLVGWRNCDIISEASSNIEMINTVRRSTMEVSVKEFKRCARIKVTGRIDSSTAPRLAQAFESLNEAGQFKIVLDMSGVDFISSAGLRVLISAQKTCKRWNRGELVLASVPEKIHDVFDLAGFLPLFRFFDEVVDAVGSF